MFLLTVSSVPQNHCFLQTFGVFGAETCSLIQKLGPPIGREPPHSISDIYISKAPQENFCLEMAQTRLKTLFLTLFGPFLAQNAKIDK